jgi:uncharacterized FlaG/YvyC family protein
MQMNIQEIRSALVHPLKVLSDEVKSNLSPSVKKTGQPTSEEIKASVSQINQYLNQRKVDINFSIDSNSKIPVITVTNTSTGEIILQFPSKVILAVAEAIDSKQLGALIENKA